MPQMILLQKKKMAMKQAGAALQRNLGWVWIDTGALLNDHCLV
jgi:hypothetical protein